MGLSEPARGQVQHQQLEGDVAGLEAFQETFVREAVDELQCREPGTGPVVHEAQGAPGPGRGLDPGQAPLDLIQDRRDQGTGGGEAPAPRVHDAAIPIEKPM